mmetsp:Transcript_12256/g.19919  ORF Transcript_12256/g.19919 Transcript_12256/m.19919 type:complete len:210 (+) Transcript_12256:482-1111(+)
MMKRTSAACARNRDPILRVLKDALDLDANASRVKRVLEVGSGTGEHGYHFTQAFPESLVWQPTDVDTKTLDENPKVPGVLDAMPLDVTCKAHWDALAGSRGSFDAIFTANTLHIMPWSSGVEFLTRSAELLQRGGGGKLIIYGPFKYKGEFTTESNRQFNDGWLTSTFPQGGIRDFELVERVLIENNMQLVEDIAMPANNQMLIFSSKL